MIKKLRLGNNFPRKLPHVHKFFLGIGLIDPNAVVGAPSIKPRAASKRSQGKSRTIMPAQE